MNNKKLFNYINQHGGNSNNIIKINNLDSMIDFESSDVIDNTEDYTSSLLSKILSNGINDNDVLSDSSGGTPIWLARTILTSKISDNIRSGVIDKVRSAIKNNKGVDTELGKSKNKKKAKTKTKRIIVQKADSETKTRETKTRETKKNNLNFDDLLFDDLLEELSDLKKTILENMNDNDLRNINVNDTKLNLIEMLTNLKKMKKQLGA